MVSIIFHWMLETKLRPRNKKMLTFYYKKTKNKKHFTTTVPLNVYGYPYHTSR